MTELMQVRQGLDEGEVARARVAHGANVLSSKKRLGFWRRFLANLGDPVIKILLAALVLNLLFIARSHEWPQTVGIAVSVLLATLISTASEYGSEASFLRLCETCGTAKCRARRREVMEIASEEIVVGDVVLLSAGDRIPADGVLLYGSVTVDQAALTGESREIEKVPNGLDFSADPVAKHILLCGSVVLSGSAEMLVCAVGDGTMIGGISGELQEQERESPLKTRLRELARVISRVGYVAAAVCAIAFLFHRLVIDADFYMPETLLRVRDARYMASLGLQALMLALTVVVVAVPEGLPMMIAVVLSGNIRRMTRDHVLVRKPAGLEAAGSMNILFTDKTGTLTTGRLTPVCYLSAAGEYASYRAFCAAERALGDRVALAAVANNGAERGVRDGRPVALGGNSTDRALLEAFLAAPVPPFSVRERLVFDSVRKFSATALSDGRVFVTGAPERLMPFITKAQVHAQEADSFEKAAFYARLRAHMENGERVLLLAQGSAMPKGEALPPLTLLCAVAFADPRRPEARGAVETLQRAGVQVVMMTGDGKETAVRIARECGLVSGNSLCLDGSELAAMDNQTLSEALPRLAVVSRALPRDKSRLVRLCAEKGLVVGMTGDGINDAPALKSADVGFAMGSGTQVAKEAGDVVVLDDNLSSLCRAVLYGRTIFKSIRKFITLQLIMNFCAVGISIIGPFIGVDAPVTVVQMLWINLIMDTLGGLAFAGEAPMPHYMREPPKRRDEPIITGDIAARIAFLSLSTVVLFVLFLKLPFVRAQFRVMPNALCLLTAFFALFIFAGVFHCFHARTDRVNLLAGLSKNPTFMLIMCAVAAVQLCFVYLGGSVLRTVPLTLRELALTLCLAAVVLPLGWLDTVFRRLRGKESLY
ncbi:MAG: calcium-translocating P-type ATPase, PMCA-type [Ruminococcaceae bacterium]|nr:calcium-translocating P-type ATPase, PMCA-type [Oscillospiraceae bacterium]